MSDSRDLCLLADVKAWLSPTMGAVDDALLVRLITAASVTMQQWMNRTIPLQAYTENRNGQDTRAIMLSNYPLVTVISVVIDGVAIALAAGNLNVYTGYAFDQTSIYLAGYKFTRGFQNVSLAYTAGFAITPIELSQACIDLVCFRYRERDRIGMTSKAMAGETTSYTVADFPKSTLAMMNNYKKVVPL